VAKIQRCFPRIPGKFSTLINKQTVLSSYSTRKGFINARTTQASQIQNLLREHGITVPQGIGKGGVLH